VNKTTTGRGFGLIEFKDSNGILCNIQKSSAAEDDYIWLGSDKIGVKMFKKGKGWEDIDIREKLNCDEVVANNRMHLSRKKVLQLLPTLIKFAIFGEI
jgi:hypothetical protein